MTISDPEFTNIDPPLLAEFPIKDTLMKELLNMYKAPPYSNELLLEKEESVNFRDDPVLAKIAPPVPVLDL
jgi:hypothetical protein